MGQCKSKVKVLDDSDREKAVDVDAKVIKRNKRKWRRSKAYSLSASLEGDLNNREDSDFLPEAKKERNSAVLVSYSVKEERKWKGAGGGLDEDDGDEEDVEENGESRNELIDRDVEILAKSRIEHVTVTDANPGESQGTTPISRSHIITEDTADYRVDRRQDEDIDNLTPTTLTPSSSLDDVQLVPSPSFCYQSPDDVSPPTPVTPLVLPPPPPLTFSSVSPTISTPVSEVVAAQIGAANVVNVTSLIVDIHSHAGDALTLPSPPPSPLPSPPPSPPQQRSLSNDDRSPRVTMPEPVLLSSHEPLTTIASQVKSVGVVVVSRSNDSREKLDDSVSQLTSTPVQSSIKNGKLSMQKSDVEKDTTQKAGSAPEKNEIVATVQKRSSVFLGGGEGGRRVELPIPSEISQILESGLVSLPGFQSPSDDKSSRNEVKSLSEKPKKSCVTISVPCSNNFSKMDNMDNSVVYEPSHQVPGSSMSQRSMPDVVAMSLPKVNKSVILQTKDVIVIPEENENSSHAEAKLKNELKSQNVETDRKFVKGNDKADKPIKIKFTTVEDLRRSIQQKDDGDISSLQKTPCSVDDVKDKRKKVTQLKEVSVKFSSRTDINSHDKQEENTEDISFITGENLNNLDLASSFVDQVSNVRESCDFAENDVFAKIDDRDVSKCTTIDCKIKESDICEKDSNSNTASSLEVKSNDCYNDDNGCYSTADFEIKGGDIDMLGEKYISSTDVLKNPIDSCKELHQVHYLKPLIKEQSLPYEDLLVDVKKEFADNYSYQREAVILENNDVQTQDINILNSNKADNITIISDAAFPLIETLDCNVVDDQNMLENSISVSPGSLEFSENGDSFYSDGVESQANVSREPSPTKNPNDNGTEEIAKVKTTEECNLFEKEDKDSGTKLVNESNMVSFLSTFHDPVSEREKDISYKVPEKSTFNITLNNNTGGKEIILKGTSFLKENPSPCSDETDLDSRLADLSLNDEEWQSISDVAENDDSLSALSSTYDDLSSLGTKSEERGDDGAYNRGAGKLTKKFPIHRKNELNSVYERLSTSSDISVEKNINFTSNTTVNSIKDDYTEISPGDTCYDSLEDLRRGLGRRKLPSTPLAPASWSQIETTTSILGSANLNDSLEDLSSLSEDTKSFVVDMGPRKPILTRSQTFTSQGNLTDKPRRKLPDIPHRVGYAPSPSDDCPNVRRAVSVGRDQRYDPGFFSLSDEKDSGCPPSLDMYGEETCVDPPPNHLETPAKMPVVLDDSGVSGTDTSVSSSVYLPRRNQTNFLWVDFENKDKVKKRSKVHERLSTSIAKKSNRHSAPPGSLDDFSNQPHQPCQKILQNRQRQSLGDRQGPTGRRGFEPTCLVSRSESDKGRIHSAVVSGINVETKSVTVEWFERGETKGKEIELEQILGLNQDLAPENVIPSKVQKYVARPPPPAAGRGGRVKNPSRQSHVLSSNGHSKEDPKLIEQSMPPPKQVPSLPPEKNETVSKATAAVAAKSLTADRRRSNVVKEVERLKENREKRRAQQAQILEEKEALRNVDPGNPNWEFLQMILDYKDQLEFNPLQDGDPLNDHQITVCVRKRPMSQKETKKKEVDVVTCPNKDQVIIHEPKTKVDLTKYLENGLFRFDYAFDENASNELVYKYTARPLVQSIFDGGMATCFAYGQTGSGKTHTMGGEFQGKTQDSKNGVYAFATRDVFKLLKSPKYKQLNLGVCCSYFEIYSGKVFDLLSGKSKLRVLEDGKQQVVIVGLTEKEVDCVEDVLKLITHGNGIRTSGQTSANAHSSRSHAVFQIILRQNNNKRSLYGKFSLIDLAGNERGADTSSANRQTRMEGAEINKSLLALKECIRALGRKGAHLPFRASKLTQVLRDSFIGEKARTCMIAMISPTLSSCEHTLNTLRYADRVKELGAADPVDREQRTRGPELELYDDEESGRMDDGVMSPEDSDLAQLRSLNDGECSADWYNFQESVAHLQLLEEEVVESHKNLLDSMEHWLHQDASLLAMSNEVDYDQDAYAQQLEDMIAEKQEALMALREKTRAFRECLNEEEMRSKNLNLRRN